MATCSTGFWHSVCLADDGVIHAFGDNSYGQLGLGHEENVPIPSPILNLPKIKMVSCGSCFTVCVDEEGSMWSFGENNFGQLGIGNRNQVTKPRKVQDIPAVHSISCGYGHTLIVTNDSNLWVCGYNAYGQLFLGNKVSQLKPVQTSYSNVLMISSGTQGSYYSYFQNDIGEIYVCGHNEHGQLGLGINSECQLQPCVIPDLPPEIIQFCCGYNHSLFLDCNGNVFSVGYNNNGNLGLGHHINQNSLQQIPNIPPIRVISCVGQSSYLIDFDENLWSFGDNRDCQLGFKSETDNVTVPTQVKGLEFIQQISSGCCGEHFFAQDSQNTIFIMGNNGNGQLSFSNKPREMNNEYFSIWGKPKNYTRAKSARK